MPITRWAHETKLLTYLGDRLEMSNLETLLCDTSPDKWLEHQKRAHPQPDINISSSEDEQSMDRRKRKCSRLKPQNPKSNKPDRSERSSESWENLPESSANNEPPRRSYRIHKMPETLYLLRIDKTMRVIKDRFYYLSLHNSSWVFMYMSNL